MPETHGAMPDPLENLPVEQPTPGSRTDDTGIHHAPTRHTRRSRDDVGPPIIGVRGDVLHAGTKPVVPLHGHTEQTRAGLDLTAAETRIQHQRLHITDETDTTVHLRLDIIVQPVPVAGIGEPRQNATIGGSHLDGLEDTVRITEGGTRQSRRVQPQMR